VRPAEPVVARERNRARTRERAPLSPWLPERGAPAGLIGWSGPHDNLATMDSWRRAELPVLPGSGPAPWLHDTATGELTLASAGPVATLYACGITPYDATHIGHAATYTAWDLLVRAWLDASPEDHGAAGGRYSVICSVT